jgi:Undecaprenyl-phosphate glucose phosphotransferase
VLYRYSEVFRSLLLVADLALVSASWLAAYWIRFHTGLEDLHPALASPLGVPDVRQYELPLLVVVPLWWVLFRRRGLYEARRTRSLLGEAGAVIQATLVGVLLLVALTFFVRSYFYSRVVIAIFTLLSASSIVALRIAGRLALRSLRKRGYNLRYVLVVGGGVLAEELLRRIDEHPEAGLRVRCLLTEGDVPRRLGEDVELRQGYGRLKEVLHAERIDQVILALPREQWDRLEKLLRDLDDEVAGVMLAPDLLDLSTLHASVEDMDGLPLINLRQSPMEGWARIQKRSLDLAVSGVALLLLSPLFALIALAVWLGSGRPVLYAQERMGLDGRVFRAFKFRTMVPNAEDESGPVWTTRDDPRRTRLGAFLRRTSLDELPQLWNVLKGEMSVVGPRPERPVFIEEFRREIPGYMLRHKVKAGLTGWAQVHGWRGDTSLNERVEHDLYYIQHWSMGLDLRILLMTIWRGLFHRNAY